MFCYNTTYLRVSVTKIKIRMVYEVKNTKLLSVRCPVATVGKVADTRRLLVGDQTKLPAQEWCGGNVLRIMALYHFLQVNINHCEFRIFCSSAWQSGRLTWLWSPNRISFSPGTWFRGGCGGVPTRVLPTSRGSLSSWVSSRPYSTLARCCSMGVPYDQCQGARYWRSRRSRTA